jgi:hypothetical protein
VLQLVVLQDGVLVLLLPAMSVTDRRKAGVSSTSVSLRWVQKVSVVRAVCVLMHKSTDCTTVPC